MVIPGKSSCLECLERAARREYPLYEEVAAWRGRSSVVDASVGPVSGLIGSLLACEALHLLTGAFNPASVNAALVLDLRTMTLTKESILPDRSCSACGDHAASTK
jgi:bacteriocin biosynthesis cyclodehydratase domain-containing protein